MDKNHDLLICCLHENHLRTKDLHRLKVKGWKKYSMKMDMKKKAGVKILISDKIDLKTKAITGNNKGHYIILKGIVNKRI